jgi:hypothetical protein
MSTQYLPLTSSTNSHDFLRTNRLNGIAAKEFLYSSLDFRNTSHLAHETDISNISYLDFGVLYYSLNKFYCP